MSTFVFDDVDHRDLGNWMMHYFLTGSVLEDGREKIVLETQ
jgi:hypothetical protein